MSMSAYIRCPFNTQERKAVAEKVAKKIRKKVYRPGSDQLVVHYPTKDMAQEMRGEDVADQIMAAATEIKSVLHDFPGLGESTTESQLGSQAGFGWDDLDLDEEPGLGFSES
jgi:hypothetical protein